MVSIMKITTRAQAILAEDFIARKTIEYHKLGTAIAECQEALFLFDVMEIKANDR